ncbi:MAG: hypothetical protein ACYSTS_03850 [Planctomycetota bacterium]|jgi:hypothetical protein
MIKETKVNQKLVSWQTCNYCEKSGWLLILDSDGLCDNCNRILSSRIRRTIQIISKTAETIDKAKRLKTKLSKLCLIEDVVQKQILPLERNGIKATNQTSDQILEQVKNLRDEVISEYLKDLLSKAKTKVEKAKTKELKINAYSEVLKKITVLKDKVAKTDIISNFEIKVKQQLAKLLISGIMKKTKAMNQQKL